MNKGEYPGINGINLAAKQKIKEKNYWLHKLSGELVKTCFPPDYPGNKNEEGRGTVIYRFPPLCTASLSKVTGGSDLKMHIMLTAALVVLLHKYTGNQDICLGTSIFKQEIEGDFINTVLALRTYTRDTMTFKELLLDMKQTILEAVDNRNYPMEILAKQLNKTYAPGDDFPLFDVTVLLENIQDKKYLRHIRTNIGFSFTRTGEDIEGIVDYNTGKYEKTTIHRIIDHFTRLLRDVSTNLDLKLSQIDILSQEEKTRVLFDFNNTGKNYSIDKPLHRLFEEQVERTPDRTALVGKEEGGKGRRVEGKKEEVPFGQVLNARDENSLRTKSQELIAITYRELNEKSEQLAYLLMEKGVQPDTIVGIMTVRSPDMVIGIYGILKAGGAYLPIDSQYPEERITYMLKDSGAKILLSAGHHHDHPSSQFPSFSQLPNFPASLSANLAYVIYTSGSTGKPKGVMIKHDSVVDILFSLFDAYPFKEKDTYLFKTPYVFDVSLTELFGWVIGGGRLAILEKEAEKDPEKIADTIASQQVTHINFVPSMFSVFADWLTPQTIGQLSSLKYIFLAGEPLLPVMVNKFRALTGKTRLENIYGPTEAAIYAGRYSLSQWNGSGNIPIGKPMPNIRLYILDRYDYFQPIGVPGELCISGICLARGYLNNPELTFEKFCLRRPGGSFCKNRPLDPHKNFLLNLPEGHLLSTTHHSPLTIYRTGDLARWQPDGNIEFLGRIDRQVKIRGIRIEMGEIENALLNHEQIKEAVVITREHESGGENVNPGDKEDKFLCAYFIPSAPGGISAIELKEYLSARLPDYMIPTYFTEIEKIPLTPTGKPDREVLPTPGIKREEIYLAPRDETEKKLASIWSEILRIDTIGIDENFFKLGGHSLRAVMMLSKVHKEFNVKIPLAQVFKIPTVRGLAQYVKGAGKEKYLAIEPVEKKEYYSLSSAQKRLYILQQMELASTAYNMPQTIPLQGEPDIKKLEETFSRLINHHESLRTSFHMASDEPVQKVHDTVEFKVEYYDMKEVEAKVEEDRSPVLEGTRGLAPWPKESTAPLISSFIRPFDLSKAPLLKVGIVKIGERRYVLAVVMHHIISDGVSQDLLVKDFMELYTGEQLPPLQIQYKDFSGWQNSKQQKENSKKQEHYWLRVFEGEIPVLHLPCDFPRPPVQGFAGSAVNFGVEERETVLLKKLALEQGCTIYMVLLAIYNIFLAKISSQEDIVVGTPTAGRRHADLEKVIGMFVNTLALRNFLDREQSFMTFLRSVRETTIEAFENQDCQFEDLVEKVTVTRDPSRNPLFDVLFVLQNIDAAFGRSPGQPRQPYQTAAQYEPQARTGQNEQDIQETPGNQVNNREPQGYGIESQTAKFDLVLNGSENRGRFGFSLGYSTQLFKRETIQRFLTYLKAILNAVLEDPNVKISGIEILSPGENKQLLYDFNDTRIEYPRHRTLHGLFEDQVVKTPDNIAVVGTHELHGLHERASSEGTGGLAPLSAAMSITYSQLNEKSNRLTHLLKEKGIQPDTIVGIMVERSLEMVIGILGILKAGGAYLPIDPQYPEERITYMLKDSKAKVLVTTSSLAEEGKKVRRFEGKKILLEEFFETPSSSSTLPPFHPSTVPSFSLAYIIYTSGSTGRPKGVLVEHYNAVNVVCWFGRSYLAQPHTHVAMMSDYTFDPSVNQVFGTLLHRGVLYILEKELLLNLERLRQYIEMHQVQVVNFVPAAFNELLGKGKKLESIEVVLSGGERLDEVVKTNIIQKGYILYNQYGPTETTIDALVEKCAKEEKVLLGKPIANTRCFILDRYGHLLPIGVAGELVVGGDGVTRGYLNNPELTFDKFCLRRPGTFLKKGSWTSKNFLLDLSPLTSHHSPLYRTGDLARWLDSGKIEFLGRVDSQVKIRGFRVEPGEIEDWLRKHEAVKDAVVLAREAPEMQGVSPGDKYLCAYIVPVKETPVPLLPAEIKEFLSHDLPVYMIPSYFVFIEAIPLTPTGKIDRKALPVPGIQTGSGYAAPGNAVEELLVETWSEVLGLEKGKISIDDNFFQLGGHSLKAVIMSAKAHKALDVKIPLAEIFKTPTIRGLSQYIKKVEKNKYLAIEPVEKKEYYTLSSAQKRLYILQQIELQNTAYNIPEAISLTREPDGEKLGKTFIQLIQRHESLRTSFHMVSDRPVQRVHDTVEFNLGYYEAGIHSSPVIRQHFDSAFDLSKAPLLKVGLVKTDERKFILVVVMHHIVSDGVSHEILMKDFMALDESKELPPLRTQYKDFSQWQNREKQKEELKHQELYWLKEFEGEIPVLNLPTDFPRPIIQSFAGNTVNFEIGKIETQLLKTNARQEGITLFMLLLTITNIWLAKVSNQEDIVIGIPIAGRRHADLEKIIGMFVNTLALRNYPEGEKNFKNFLSEVKQNTLEAFENQEYQFEDLVEKVSVHRDASRNPLFDVMYTFQIPDQSTNDKSKENPGGKQPDLDDEDRYGTAKFDLTLTGTNADEKLLFTIQYSTKLFKKETIQRFVTYFKKIVSTIANEPMIPLGKIDILWEKERNRLLYDFNDTAREYPQNKTLQQLFEEKVDRNPNNAAVIFHDREFTYKELNHKSNQSAEVLREKGVLADTIVGMMMERSIDMIIGLMAILKAGGAYLPIDPQYPQDRIDFMLKDSSAKILLSTGHHHDYPSSQFPSFSQLPGFPASLPSSLAYIIYTSGSTGNPKGVLIRHYSVVNILFALSENYPLLEKDTYLFKTSYVFDVSVSELFGWFFHGGRLAILENGAEKDPQKISGTIERQQVTHINFVPSMFNVFVDWLNLQTIRQLTSLKYIFLAGEALLPPVVKKFKELDTGIRLENIYGPTEAAIYASEYSLSQWEDSKSVPIGKPLSNIKLYIFDHYDCLVPVGVPGELCISGTCLARGYLNQPGLTAEKFCLRRAGGTLFEKTAPPAPPRKNFLFERTRGAAPFTIYHTGDLTRWQPDGNIEFIGRIDQQVKIRGYRIELGEIESYLLKHPDVKETVVLERDDGNGNKYLCAYIVLTKKNAPDQISSASTELRNHLSQSLPGYMIPSYFTYIENIPLTPGGKVDRKILPVPKAESRTKPTAPRDEIEKKLVEIWIEVLNIEGTLGIDDNFFQLGGHSLTAVIMCSKVHKTLNVKIPLAEIFRTPNIREIAQYIATAREIQYTAIEPAEKKEYYILSSTQKRMYILQQMELNNTVYNMPEIIPLDQEPDINKLEETLMKLINRHESLRTSFHIVTDEPIQRIHDEVEFEIEYYDMKEVEVKVEVEEERASRFEGTRGLAPLPIENFIRPFDITQAPLLRVGLIQPRHTPSALRGHPSQEGRKHKSLLIVDMHHIISDGISRNILGRDFMSLYQAEDLPLLRLQYKDYAQWLNKETREEITKNQETFWLETFDDEIPVLDIPTDYLRSTVQSFTGDVVSFDMGKRVTALLKQLARDEGVTLYMFLLALCNVWLSRLSSQEDIIIGTPIAGRRHADLQQIMGMFVNTLAMRNFPAGEKTFTSFLQEVKEKALAAFENQEYPFEELVDKLEIKRDVSRNPLFDFMLVMQNLYNNETSAPQDKEEAVEKISTAEQEVHGYEHEHRIAKFDMTLIAVESGNNLFFTFQYCTRLFKRKTIERFIVYFQRIISGILENRSELISNIEMIPPGEKQQLLVVFNDTQAQYPKNKTIHELFAEQAGKTPDNIAAAGPRLIKHKSYRTYMTYISYRELNKKSLQLAHLLRDKGIKPDTIAGIMLERSIEMIIGILGILKAGGAYLPIDPQYPQERINYMLKDSNAKILLTGQEIAGFSSPQALYLSEGRSFTNDQCPMTNDQLAYVIYTSGSTGKPKGTMVQHRSLVNACHWQAGYYNITEKDHAAQYASFVFDASVLEIFPCLIQGASLYIIDEEIRPDPGRLNRYYEKIGITIGFLPTQVAEWFMTLGNRSLRVLIAAGDKLRVFIKQDYRVYNNYGPTENTVVAAAFLVDRQYPNIPIGKPIQNNYFYILSPDHFHLQPIGMVGELCIGGDSLSRGYLNNPELTAEKFDHDLWALHDYHDETNKSFCGGPGGSFFKKRPLAVGDKLYRTGDLARWLPDGNIEFLGRSDHQVKIRGFRIELAEIENRLLNHPGIKEAVVLARRHEDKDQYLCAYIVPTYIEILDKPGLNSIELKEYLAHTLPDYMIPSHFIVIKKIPLTRSGKIDGNALPLPGRKTGDTYAAPCSETEKKLVEIWSEVLGIEKDIIGIDHNFFELGGHSLKAAIMTSMVQTRLNVAVPLVELFKTPTIKQLSDYIHTLSGQPIMEFPGDKNLVLLNKAADNEKYLFFVHDGSGEVEGYIEFCGHLTGGFNCWGIRMARSANLGPQNHTIEELAAQYIQKVRKVQSAGPYFIVGWSLGGTIAFEMCRQLEQCGEKNGFLALIDAVPPKSRNIGAKKRNEFTITSELKWIQSYFRDKDIKKKLKKAADINRFWQQVLEYLEEKSVSIDALKQLIPGGMARILPKSTHSNIKEFIYYVNVIRTLDNARNFYTPGGKVRSTAYFFKAGQSIIDEDLWSHYCEKPLEFRTISGDHFSIFKEPGVIDFAEAFSQSLSKRFPG